MTGVNYLNKDSVRSITCKNYGIDAAKFSTVRNFPSPEKVFSTTETRHES